MLRCILSSLVAFAFILGAILLAPSVKAEDYVDFTFQEPVESLPIDSSLANDIFTRCETLLKRDYPNADTFIKWVGSAYGDYFLYVTAVDTDADDLEFYYLNQGGRWRLFFNSSSISSCGFAYGMTTTLSSGEVYTQYPSGTSSSFDYTNTIDNVVYFSLPVNVNCLGDSSVPQYVNFSGRTKISSSASDVIPIQPFEPLLFTNAPAYGSVDSISNARLLAGLYDITFTPTVSFPSNFPLIGKTLKVVPISVRDDTGYNLVSLQVPQLGTYTDVVVFGEYHFVPRKSSSETYFNGLKFSFGSEPLNENDEEYDGTITPSMFSCVVDGQPLKPKGMTANSLSFFYNTKLHKYSNCEFTIFDYSSTDSHIYPAVRFMGIGSINGMSAGSICYNCDFSGLVSSQSPSEIAEEGEEEISDTVEELGYVPRSVTYPDPSEGFTFDDPSAPDFSALGNIFSFMFNNRIIRAMLEMCLVVGLAGYVMYGKKGD